MNDAYFSAFNQFIVDEVYVAGDHGQMVTQLIQEEKYAFDLLFKVSGSHGVVFRIEDFKAKAGYLVGTKRGHGMDNDCTIIDQAIFQIEVKDTKGMGNTHTARQFTGGMKWLRHILDMVVSDQDDLRQVAQMPVYNLVIRRTGRASLDRSRKYPVRLRGRNFLVMVSKNDQRIDLTKVKAHLLSSEWSPSGQFRF
ncbi:MULTISPECIES: hypothetical protein [Lactobacillaceae]|uniref:hypothetical protein n=1 Tax=Lactobacillaceae TaxID=33958 RepID=UPI0014578B21|nr:hypothetical protein [Lactobacillus sp. HBUAS51381]NLR09555.1 hypothetical protein [Lactobacillus sp. HBUAS51381]